MTSMFLAALSHRRERTICCNNTNNLCPVFVPQWGCASSDQPIVMFWLIRARPTAETNSSSVRWYQSCQYSNLRWPLFCFCWVIPWFLSVVVAFYRSSWASVQVEAACTQRTRSFEARTKPLAYFMLLLMTFHRLTDQLKNQFGKSLSLSLVQIPMEPTHQVMWAEIKQNTFCLSTTRYWTWSSGAREAP